jgi:PilZ domain
MKERRNEIRMMCADMIDVCWRDGAGKARRATGLLEDISRSGACLQMESAVPLGAEVRWHTGQQEFSGTVRYCVYREIGYFIGVEFALGTRWSKQIYKPPHLLDVRLTAPRT